MDEERTFIVYYTLFSIKKLEIFNFFFENRYEELKRKK